MEASAGHRDPPSGGLDRFAGAAADGVGGEGIAPPAMPETEVAAGVPGPVRGECGLGGGDRAGGGGDQLGGFAGLLSTNVGPR